jgi:hypothetical protein
MTPSNRTELVFEYLQTMTSHINKYSIDTAPFIGEPWRAWIHYSIAFGQWLGITYSYAIETDWNHWFMRNQDSCALINANNRGTYSDLEQLTTMFTFREPTADELDMYKKLKSIAFDKFDTPKALIKWFAKELSKQLQIELTFESYLTNKSYILPNLGIFKFIAEENQRRMSIYNELITTTNI